MTASPLAARAAPAAILPWALGSLFFCYAFIHRVTPSVMVEDLMRDFGVGAAALGNLAAYYVYAYAALQLPVGLLMDRFGPRLLMSLSAALAAVGGLLFASADSVAVASLARLLIGIGCAFSWVGAMTITASGFPPRRFALMVGLAQLIGMIGAVFGQVPVAYAVDHLGWRGTLLALGASGLVLALAIWLGVPERRRAAQAAAPGLLRGLAVVMRNPQTWVCAVFGMAMTAPILAYGGLWAIPALMTGYGLDRPTAAVTATLMFVGWGAGCPLIGWLADRTGRRRLLMLASGTVAVATLAPLVLVGGLPMPLLWLLILLHGAAASVMVVGFACVKDVNPPGLGSSAMGVVNTAVVGGAALLQPFIGWLLDRAWDGTEAGGVRVYSPAAYQEALLVLPLLCALGIVAALLLRAPVRTT